MQKLLSFKNTFSNLIGFPVCGGEPELPETDFNYCTPDIVLSEIKTMYLGKTNTYAFTDWNDVNEWEGRVSQTSQELEALRPIMVIGDKPLPQTTIKVISNRRKVALDKLHVINCVIDEASDLIHEFAIAQKSGRYMKLWYETMGNHMYGGNKGIIAFVTIEMVLARGGGEIVNYIVTASWYDLYTEERIPSPFINSTPCPEVTNLTFVTSSPDSVVVRWDDTVFPSYEYAYNTTGDDPEDEDYIETVAHEITIDSLDEDTEYFIFVRIMCTDVLRGLPVSVNGSTTLMPRIELSEVPGFDHPEWESGSVVPVIIGDVVGSPVWEYSPDSINWYPIVAAFPVAYDSRFQCNAIFPGDSVSFTNLHREMGGWLVRLTKGSTVSNTLVLAVTPYTIDIYYFNDRVVTAGGVITDPELAALRRFIKDMDGVANSYTTHPIANQMVGIYPMVGSSAATQNISLLNALFPLTDNGTVAHGANGISYGGAGTDFSDTGIVPDVDLYTYSSQHLSVYQRSTTPNDTAFGGTTTQHMNLFYGSGKVLGFLNGSSGDYNLGSLGLSTRAFVLSRDGGYQNLAFDGGTNQLPVAPVINGSTNILLGKTYGSGSGVVSNNVQFAFATVGNGLTLSEATGLRDAINAYVTAVGRNV